MEEIVREYLLQNPEIIREANVELQRRESLAVEAEFRKAILNNHERIFSDGISVEIGNPYGDVTLVEFYDYQCPYCRRIHKDILKLVEEDKNLRLVLKQYPVKDVPNQFPSSQLAAMIAMAADEQDRFMIFHNNVFVATGLGKLNRQRLIQIAINSGLDIKRMWRDIEGAKIIESIRDNFDLAHQIGITGTPGFVVGDQVINGPPSADILKAAIAKLRESRQAMNPGQ